MVQLPLLIAHLATCNKCKYGKARKDDKLFGSVRFNHDMSSHAYIHHLLSSESLKSHHAKCFWSNFRHERDGKAPC